VCAIKAWSISSAYKNLRGQHPPPITAEMYSPPKKKIHLGYSMLANKTFLFVDQSLPDDFFHGTRKESLSITFLSDFGYLEQFRKFRDQSRKLSKIVLNFGRSLLSQILGGWPSKSYTHVMTPVPRHVVWKMFCGDTPISPEVIVANTLNFKANFKF